MQSSVTKHHPAASGLRKNMSVEVVFNDVGTADGSVTLQSRGGLLKGRLNITMDDGVVVTAAELRESVLESLTEQHIDAKVINISLPKDVK